MAYYGAKGVIPFSKLSFFSIIWSGSLGLITVLFIKISNHDFTIFTPKQLVFLSSAYIIGTLLTIFYSSLFYAKHDFRSPNLVLTITNILLIGIVGVAIWFKYQIVSTIINWYFSMYLIQGLLLAISFIIKTGAGYTIQLLTRKELRDIFSYSWKAFWANLLFFLLYRIDYFFIKNICTVCKPEDLGNYIQVSKIVQIFMLLPTMIASGIFPVTAGNNKEQMEAHIQAVSRILFLITCACCLLVAFIGKWLFPWLFGITFYHMYVPFLFMIPGILALSTIYPLTAYYAGDNKIMLNIKALIVSLAFMVAGDLLLIPLVGIEGAAITSSLSYIVYCGIILIIFKREYKMRIIDFFFVKRADIGRLFSIIFK